MQSKLAYNYSKNLITKPKKVFGGRNFKSLSRHEITKKLAPLTEPVSPKA